MIHRVITSIVGQMAREGLIMPQETEDYVYTYEVICEKVISLGAIMILGLMLNNIVNTVLYMMFLLSLRKRTGGFHMPSFFMCYVSSISVYILTYCCIRYMYNFYVFIILLSISVLVIGIIGTVNHPDMHMNSAELSGSKRIARINLAIELGVIIISIYIGIDKVSIGYMMMGVIQCAFLLFMAKIIKQEVK